MDSPKNPPAHPARPRPPVLTSVKANRLRGAAAAAPYRAVKARRIFKLTKP